MSRQHTAPAATTSTEQAAPPSNGSSTVAGLTESQQPTAPSAAPALAHNNASARVTIDITHSPPLAPRVISRAIPSSIPPKGGQRVLLQGPVQHAASEQQQQQPPPLPQHAQPYYMHPGYIHPPTQYAQQGPQAQQQPRPQQMDRCPRCNFMPGQPLQGPAPPTPAGQQGIQQQAPIQQQWPLPAMEQPQLGRRPYNYAGPPPNHPNAHLYVPNGISDHSLPRPHESKPGKPKNPNISPTSPPPPITPLPEHPRPPRPASTYVHGEHTLRSAGPGEEVIINPDGTRIVRARKTDNKVLAGQRAKSRRLTRDERIEILLMRRLGYTYEVIAKFLGATISGVHYTCRQGNPDTKHHLAGRKVKIAHEVVERLIKYVEEYQAKERAAGINKKTGKKNVESLTYNMIRDELFRDKMTGEIPKELTFTDDALKNLLNKQGIWLRQRQSAAKIEEARARGKKQWLDKLEKDRQAAERAAAEAAANPGRVRVMGFDTSHEAGAMHVRTVQPPSDAELERMGGYAEADDEDQEMGEGEYSGTESDEDDDADEQDQEDNDDMQVGDQLIQAIASHPIHAG